MVIPVGDHNPTRRRALVNGALVIVNVVVFVLWQPWAGLLCRQEAFFLEWAAVPDEIATRVPLDQSEVAATTDPRCGIDGFPDKNVYASVFTAMFLHAGWAHLAGNMLFLLIFGNNVEDRLGHLRYLAFYVASGVIATLIFVLPNAASATTLVGASGAIAGVLGAYFVLFPRAWVTVILPPLFFLPFRLPALIVLGGWFLVQIFSDRVADMAGGGVAYLAHSSGFVAGALIVLLLGYRTPRPRHARRVRGERR